MLQLDVLLQQRALGAPAVGHVARSRQDTLQFVVSIMDCRGVVRHEGLSTVAGADRQLVVAQLVFSQDTLDGCVSPGGGGGEKKEKRSETDSPTAPRRGRRRERRCCVL